jgi:hypothetical protein
VGLQPQATTRLIAGFLATGSVVAHFDAVMPLLKPALRLPTAARLVGGGLLTTASASTLISARWWKRHHH